MDKVESIDEKDIFEQQVGTSLNLRVVSLWDDKQKKWRTIGEGEFGSTRDGEHWGALQSEAMSIDNDLMNSVAVVMRTLNNITISPEFGEKLLQAVIKSEEITDEPEQIGEGQS